MDITDFTQYIALGLVIAGITELISRLRAKDYWVVATIACAAITGGVFGLAHYKGLDLGSGIGVGFGLSGALKTVSMFGQKSTPQPSQVLSTRKQIKVQ